VAGKKGKDCIFCNHLKSKDDAKNFVLYRGKTAFIVMNLYPYSNGHLLVVPNRHLNKFDKLTPQELSEMMELAQLSVKILTKTAKPQGFNMGMNIGKAAGAGIAGHLHLHIVPRWVGDASFTTTACNIKFIPETIEGAYKRLKKTLKQEHRLRK